MPRAPVSAAARAEYKACRPDCMCITDQSRSAVRTKVRQRCDSRCGCAFLWYALLLCVSSPSLAATHPRFQVLEELQRVEGERSRQASNPTWLHVRSCRLLPFSRRWPVAAPLSRSLLPLPSSLVSSDSLAGHRRSHREASGGELALPGCSLSCWSEDPADDAAEVWTSRWQAPPCLWSTECNTALVICSQ
jgi:hypothetical protein